ncbi:MAG: hypothetical protein NC453_16020 [Muribaculum sp.]|nr:hypothetical protein [Muribaculum sp.]
MKTLNEIQTTLQSVEFDSIGQWLCDFLRVFEIPETTIKKLVTKICERRNLVPVSLYNRAVFIFAEKEIDDLPILAQYRSSYSLVFIIRYNSFSLGTTDNKQFISIPFDNISDYSHYLLPLQTKGRIEKDVFSTLDFAPIVGELNTRLVLGGNEKDDAFNFIIDLITISFIDQALSGNVIGKYANWLKSATPSEVTNYISAIIREGNYDAFVSHSDSDLRIDNATKELIYRLLTFDVTSIDSEILGSLVYRFFDESEESTLYGNQTSRSYINRVLEPLFVLPFKEALCIEDYSKAYKILHSKYFDPTNSPGSFIVSAFQKVVELSEQYASASKTRMQAVDYENFIALVSNDISYRLTKLNFFIVYIQYQLTYFKISSEMALSIFKSIRIYKDNQLRADWNLYCPNNGNVHVIGSPTFRGNRKLPVNLKDDMRIAFGTSSLTDADYSSAWLVKGARYIAGTDSKLALVLTNSVCQGTQVETVWDPIYKCGCHIDYAYTSFKWSNPETNSIAVTVIIVGLIGIQSDTPKLLFDGTTCYKCNSIGPYLIQNSELIVRAANSPISPRPIMVKGNMAYGSAAVFFDEKIKEEEEEKDPEISKYIRKTYGAQEMMDNLPRYCLWINDDELEEAKAHLFIQRKLAEITECRNTLKDCPKKLKDKPHKFRESNVTAQGKQSLVVPSVSSENREYHPMAFLFNDSIVTNLAFAIYDCDIWILALLQSKMHNIWLRLVCGQLESRIRYSNVLAYNTFPIPELTIENKRLLTDLSLDLIRIREEFCEIPLGKLYSKMPPKLKNIHSQIDEYVDSLYSKEPFYTDYSRMTTLMSMYSFTIN